MNEPEFNYNTKTTEVHLTEAEIDTLIDGVKLDLETNQFCNGSEKPLEELLEKLYLIRNKF